MEEFGWADGVIPRPKKQRMAMKVFSPWLSEHHRPLLDTLSSLAKNDTKPPSLCNTSVNLAPSAAAVNPPSCVRVRRIAGMPLSYWVVLVPK